MLVLLPFACQPSVLKVEAEIQTEFANTATIDTASSNGDETSSDGNLSFSHGDAITTIGINGSAPEDFTGQLGELLEWVDADVLSDGYAVVVGQGGLATINMNDGAMVGREVRHRMYRVAAEDGYAVMGPRPGPIEILDITDPSAPQSYGQINFSGPQHEDLAMNNQRILVGWRSAGAKLFDLAGQELMTIEVDDAFGVALHDDLALVSDGLTLKLYDISSSPTLLDSATLSATARDIEMNADYAVVALGGHGAAAYRIQDNQLQELGTFQPSGTVFSVDLDEEWMWMGAWSEVALAWLGGDSILPISREPVTDSAMAVAARNNQVLVGDWRFTTAMQHHPDKWGPELVMPATVSLAFNNSEDLSFVIRNEGATDLEWQVDSLPNSFTIQGESSLTIEPNAYQTVKLRPGSGAPQGSLTWSSNDPDEPSGSLTIRAANAGVGSQHDDFALPIIEWPTGLMGTARLSDYADKVIFLAWWASY